MEQLKLEFRSFSIDRANYECDNVIIHLHLICPSLLINVLSLFSLLPQTS